VKSKDIAVGSPVVGADGKKIGVINRVVSDATGAVMQIHVAPGGTAGIGVPVIAVPANRITGTGADVKVSLSSEEAKTLPVEGGKG
jgi:PRC-barrel domain